MGEERGAPRLDPTRSSFGKVDLPSSAPGLSPQAPILYNFGGFADWGRAERQKFFEKLWQRRIPCAVGYAESGM